MLPQLVTQYCPRCQIGHAGAYAARSCSHCGQPYVVRNSRDPLQLEAWPARQLELFAGDDRRSPPNAIQEGR